ncbi:MAG: GDSL-type esterase/lipase family protein [Ilumatobacteraceae bacterium]
MGASAATGRVAVRATIVAVIVLGAAAAMAHRVPSSDTAGAAPEIVPAPGHRVAVIVVGDSITALNLSTIELGLHDAPVPEWWIDAQPGRRTADDVAVASGILRSGRTATERLVAAGWTSPTWVIELGTNDLPALTRCGCDMVAAATSRMVQIRTAIGPSARIVWVTARHGGHPAAAVAWRQAAQAIARTDSRFSIVDWFGLSRYQTGWFVDGIHPNAVGARRLSELISDELQGLLPATIVPSTSVPPPSFVAPPSAVAVGNPGAALVRAERLQTPIAVRGGPTTATRCGAITSPVGPGSSAAGVRAVQCALATRGYDPGPVNGVYGTSTADAVSAFSRHLSLSARSQVGAAIGHALGIWNYP